MTYNCSLCDAIRLRLQYSFENAWLRTQQYISNSVYYVNIVQLERLGDMFSFNTLLERYRMKSWLVSYRNLNKFLLKTDCCIWNDGCMEVTRTKHLICHMIRINLVDGTSHITWCNDRGDKCFFPGIHVFGQEIQGWKLCILGVKPVLLDSPLCRLHNYEPTGLFQHLYKQNFTKIKLANYTDENCLTIEGLNQVTIIIYFFSFSLD